MLFHTGASAARLAVYVEIANGKCPASALKSNLSYMPFPLQTLRGRSLLMYKASLSAALTKFHI